MERNKRKVITGIVTSKSGDKSLKAVYLYKIPHPLYKKEIKRRTVVHVHDEENKCKVGDTIEIMETRPISKLKHWRVTRIIKEAPVLN
jgi:small subunit ribosomal protein S17